MQRNLFSLLTLCIITVYLVMSFGQAAQAAAWQQKVDPWVLETTAGAGETEFLVYLAEQADLSAAAGLMTKAEKGAYVYQQLTAVARRTQAPVIASLDSAGAAYRPYWIANMIWVRGDAGLVAALAQRPDVARLYANPAVALRPQPMRPVEMIESAAAVEWNINQVNAPAVWAEGYTGQGVVIGGQDTGYDWTHPALKDQYRGWEGNTADHTYNWHDAIHEDHPATQPGNPCGFSSPAPCDDAGHGTHTMGTMVGDDGAGNQIGMAPGARWIGCRNMEQGWGTPATYSECYQWFVAPYPNQGDPFSDGDPSRAPHVINNSWGCPPSEGCTEPDVLLAAVENVRAAGIVTVHSAGNSGPTCGTVSTPAAIYDASFTVGATDNSDNIATFSSRGPVLVDGSQRSKPDVSAPGVLIRSSYLNGDYSNSSGTSMAAPHVAGVVALLISANPGLAGQVDLIESLIRQSAVPRTGSQNCGGNGNEIPNNVYGHGRVDALAAVQTIGPEAPTLTISKTAAATVVRPGDLLTYTLSVTHQNATTVTHNVILTDVLPAHTTFITATFPYTIDSGIIHWQNPALPAGASWQVSLVVQVAPEVTSSLIENAYYGVGSDEIGTVTGPPVSSPVLRYNYFFPISLKE